MPRKTRRPDFEASIKRLEEIVEKLDGGGLPLEKAVQLFEEGQKLARACADQLDEADRKIQLLIRGHEGRAKDALVEIGPDEDIGEAIESVLDEDESGESP